MDLDRAEKRDSKTIKTKADEVSNVANPDDDSDEKELQELTTRFEQVRSRNRGAPWSKRVKFVRYFSKSKY